MDPQLLTIQQVAGIVGRPVNTLRDWRKKGRGPRSQRIEGRVMYREADVDRWINDVTSPVDEKASA
jgi:predicted DNA-binding transcriptional regulator AlpA